MRICLLSVVTYWHGVAGGMEIHGRVLAKELAARGHDVTVLTSRHPSGMSSDRQDGVAIHYLKDTTFASQKGNWAVECGRIFKALHENKAFDVLCCQHAIAPRALMKFARYHGVPVVIIIEGLAGWVFLSEIRQVLSLNKGYGLLGRRLLSFLYYYVGWELLELGRAMRSLPSATRSPDPFRDGAACLATRCIRCTTGWIAQSLRRTGMHARPSGSNTASRQVSG